jgi:uncharacterized small protein (DUF1192 family)
MDRPEGIKNITEPDLGEIILYQSEDGTSALDVHLKDETVWLTQKQIAALFATERSVVTKHIGNVFRTGELDREAVCAKFAHTAEDGKIYRTSFYNLDVIIAVGYRVNAKRGTQFRIWATGVLKDHLVRGYTLNQQRLAEKGVAELKQAMALLATTLESHELVSDEGRAVLEVVSRYARTWRLLLEYDEERLVVPAARHGAGTGLGLDEVRRAIAALQKELAARGEATCSARSGVTVWPACSAPSARLSAARISIRALRKRRPISSTSSSRITPFPTATSGSARSSSCFTCGGTALPVSITGPWWPWPCLPRPANLGTRNCWCD